jgi:hypothetical protein
MNGDHLFTSPGREQLSPRSVPKHNPRTDPFYSPGHHSSPETSPYSSELLSPDEMMHETKKDILFESVDWEKDHHEEKKEKKRQRTITPTRAPAKEVEYTETINLTPPMTHHTSATHEDLTPVPHQIPKPTYYSPPILKMPSPPSYQGAQSGLGIQYYGDQKEMVRRICPKHTTLLT